MKPTTLAIALVENISLLPLLTGYAAKAGPKIPTPVKVATVETNSGDVPRPGYAPGDLGGTRVG